MSLPAVQGFYKGICNQSGTGITYYLMKEDIKKIQEQESKAYGGNFPAGSAAVGLQSIIGQNDQSKADLIEERAANLPLPDDPHAASDFSSADARTINVGSGSLSGNTEGGLRDHSTGNTNVRTDGASFGAHIAGSDADRLNGGIAKDAVTRDAKNTAGLVDTINADKGYPQKNDPSSGL